MGLRIERKGALKLKLSNELMLKVLIMRLSSGGEHKLTLQNYMTKLCSGRQELSMSVDSIKMMIKIKIKLLEIGRCFCLKMG